ncbi:MAG: hypothetical protein EPO23_04280 [Xanthobacteraceae bacterium]|nr:MAG: hypothetical protein EPO23_04280 [Xanthobacteraceae bacterium]
MQTRGVVWRAAGSSVRLEHVERQISGNASQAERIIRLEAKLDAIADTLADFKLMFRRAPERP